MKRLRGVDLTITRKINSDQGWTDSPFLSGNRMLFMWNRHNFMPWILSGGVTAPQLGTDTRSGHHPNSAFLDSDVYESTYANGKWGTPVNLDYNTSRGESCIHEIVRANGTRCHYYNVQGPDARGALLACRERSVSGVWGSETILPQPINIEGGINQNVWVNSTETLMYLNSNRDGTSALWVSWRASPSSAWADPQKIDPVNVNVPGYAHDQPFLYEPTGEFFFNRDSQIHHSVWGSGGFGPVTQLQLGVDYVHEASMSNDGRTLYAAVSYPNEGRLRICRWTRSAPLGTTFVAGGPLD
jgi:hypothetical protein